MLLCPRLCSSTRCFLSDHLLEQIQARACRCRICLRVLPAGLQPANGHCLLACDKGALCLPCYWKSLQASKLTLDCGVQTVDPLAQIVHRDAAYRVGKALTGRLREVIPRQQFKIPIQAAIGVKVVASENLSGELQIPSGQLATPLIFAGTFDNHESPAR